MRNSALFLLLVLFITASCSCGKKKTKTSECENCPPAVEIVVPDELVDNQEAVVYIKDAEKQFNKWSKKAYMLSEEMKSLENMDSTNVSIKDAMRAGKVALQMAAYMTQFMEDGVVMTERREKIMSTMSEEEKQSFDKVWEQLDAPITDIARTFEALGVDVPVDTLKKQYMPIEKEEQESETVDEVQV